MRLRMLLVLLGGLGLALVALQLLAASETDRETPAGVCELLRLHLVHSARDHATDAHSSKTHHKKHMNTSQARTFSVHQDAASVPRKRLDLDASGARGATGIYVV